MYALCLSPADILIISLFDLTFSGNIEFENDDKPSCPDEF